MLGLDQLVRADRDCGRVLLEKTRHMRQRLLFYGRVDVFSLWRYWSMDKTDPTLRGCNTWRHPVSTENC